MKLFSRDEVKILERNLVFCRKRQKNTSFDMEERLRLEINIIALERILKDKCLRKEEFAKEIRRHYLGHKSLPLINIIAERVYNTLTGTKSKKKKDPVM